MILLTIIADSTRFSSKLQRTFVKLLKGIDCPQNPYHGAWYDTDTNMFYDMNIHFRKVPFEKYANRRLFFFKPPVPISRDYLESLIGKRNYGILDVLLFPISKFFGINLPGDHCTEALNDDIWVSGGKTPWSIYDSPPSPCEMLQWAIVELEAV